MQDQKKGQSTGSTGSKTGGSAGTKGRAAEQMQNRSDLPDTSTGMWAGAPPEPVTHGRGEQESEQRGMDQMTAMPQEERERDDPEMQMREEDLHARQQNLGEREKSLRERDEQLRTREQGLRERQTRITGRGLGATDYTNYQIQNTR